MFDRTLFSLPGVKRILILLACISLLYAALVFLQAFALASFVVHCWEGAYFLNELSWLALFFASYLGRQLILYAQDALLESFAAQTATTLRKSLLHSLFEQGKSLVSKQGSGSVSTLVLEGIEQVETYLALILPKMVSMFLIPLVILIAVFPFDWVSGLIMLLVFPCVIMYLVVLGRLAKANATKKHEEFYQLSSHFIDTLRGLDTLKFFGRSKAKAKEVFETSERFRRTTMATLRIATLTGMVLDLFSTFSLAAVAIMLGFRLVDGSLALFPALLVLVLVPEYFKPLREFASDYHASLDGKNALRSIVDIIDASQKSTQERLLQPDFSLETWNSGSKLCVSDLRFSYENHPALKGVSFQTLGFEKIAVVGYSGSGKSTLLNILGGFEDPHQGIIQLQGSLATTLAQPAWQRQLMYIPQNPYLFHGTLRENLCFYTPNTDELTLQEALSVVGLKDFVDSLDNGLDTIIGEGGRQLSGGQAQRVALARLFLDKTRRILLFDEPTAHLDIETELELKKRMVPLMENRLVFFATHRLHWLDSMDKVLLLHHGKVVAFGTPEEVRASRTLAKLEIPEEVFS